MIKFSGILSEDCKYYYLKNAQKINFFVFLFVSIVFIGIATIMGVFLRLDIFRIDSPDMSDSYCSCFFTSEIKAV